MSTVTDSSLEELTDTKKFKKSKGAVKPIKQSKGKKSKRGAWYYAMPWNLRREVLILGYGFAAKSMLLTYLSIAGAMFILGLGFKLPLLWMVPLFVAGFWFTPALVRNSYKNKYERHRFADVNTYIEQMLYAFKTSQRVLTSLEDVKVLFREGNAMRDSIDEAIAIIKDPSSVADGEDVELRALQGIEKRYDNDYVKSLHRFMLKVEAIGGNFDTSIDLLLENRRMWENRVHKLQDLRGQRRVNILASVIVSALLCLSLLYIFPADVNIAESVVVRVANIVLVVTYLRIYVAADSKLAVDLLHTRSVMVEDKVAKDYHRFLNYDPKKESVKSVLYSLVPSAIALLGYLLPNSIVMWAGILLLPVTLFQHKLGHHLLGKRLRQEISWAFPQWLMELALLLQSDNVQVSIFKTIDTALPIMRPELEKMRDKLIESPSSSDPFMEFFEEFNLPEITTSMQMLYALSIGAGGDSTTQISNIVHRNQIILDRAEEMRNQDSLSGMSILFLAPLLIGGFVLMVDMTVFLMTFLTKMSEI